MIFSAESASDRVEAEQLLDGKYVTTFKDLKELDAIYKIRQIRWYCHNHDGQKTIDIITQLNSKGMKVVNQFVGKEEIDFEDACGSYYTLADATLTGECDKLHWSKPTRWDVLFSKPFSDPKDQTHNFQVAIKAGRNFFFACDESKFDTGKFRALGRWMVFVR